MGVDLAPTTDKQLRIYNAFNTFKVEYVLVGGLAYIFNGRKRTTMDVDLLLNDSTENMSKLIAALDHMGCVTKGLHPRDLEEYTRLRFSVPTLLDVHSVFCMYEYGEVESYDFEYEGVTIPVASLNSCVAMLEKECKYSDDLKVLRLLSEPVINYKEINKLQ